MAVTIHTKDGIRKLPGGKRVVAGAWKTTATARANGDSSAQELRVALDRAESELKRLRQKARSSR